MRAVKRQRMQRQCGVPAFARDGRPFTRFVCAVGRADPVKRLAAALMRDCQGGCDKTLENEVHKFESLPRRREGDKWPRFVSERAGGKVGAGVVLR